MSIKKRRDAVLKSNISINSIRDSVVKFTVGETVTGNTSKATATVLVDDVDVTSNAGLTNFCMNFPLKKLK